MSRHKRRVAWFGARVTWLPQEPSFPDDATPASELTVAQAQLKEALDAYEKDLVLDALNPGAEVQELPLDVLIPPPNLVRTVAAKVGKPVARSAAKADKAAKAQTPQTPVSAATQSISA